MVLFGWICIAKSHLSLASIFISCLTCLECSVSSEHILSISVRLQQNDLQASRVFHDFLGAQETTQIRHLLSGVYKRDHYTVPHSLYLNPQSLSKSLGLYVFVYCCAL